MKVLLKRSLALMWLATILQLLSLNATAQDNYEIQVYGSGTVARGRTMVELHSNFTIDGQSETVNGVFGSEHAVHETLEITHGFYRLV